MQQRLVIHLAFDIPGIQKGTHCDFIAYQVNFHGLLLFSRILVWVVPKAMHIFVLDHLLLLVSIQSFTNMAVTCSSTKCSLYFRITLNRCGNDSRSLLHPQSFTVV